MQVTLRQAHKIVDKINAKIKTITPELTVDLSVWELSDADSVRIKLRDRLQQVNAEIDLRTELECARFEIRKAIGVANQKAVDSLLAQRKLVVDSLALNKSLFESYNSRYDLTPEAVAAQAAQTRTGANAYSGSTITVNLFEQQDMDKIKDVAAAFQLSLEKIEDALSVANADRDNLIDLTDRVDLLRQSRIIE